MEIQYCTARDCCLLKQNLHCALLLSSLLPLLMRHLVIGQRQKAPNFSAFNWSPHGCLITIGQHFVTTWVVHLPKRTETSLITEWDQRRANHQLLQLCTVRTAWSDLDQAVRALHSCKSCLIFLIAPALIISLYPKSNVILPCINFCLLF